MNKKEKNNLYDNTDVIELKNNDFKNKIIINNNFNNKYGLILFYAPWCGHCKNMVELWSELAHEYKNKYPIGAVNCEKNIGLCNKQKIRYYPKIRYVTKTGHLYDYLGNIYKDDLMFFIHQQI